MPTSHRAPYLTPYHDAHDQHGAGFGVTLWANERSQQLRFDVFTQMCYLHDKRILDAGCSRGDFAAFLIEHGIKYSRYIGVDALADVINFAKTRQLRDAEFYCGDFVANSKLLKIGKPQVITISGALNTMTISLARALAPEIRVNAVCPGAFPSRWWREGLGEEGFKNLFDKYAAAVPLKSAGDPESVARTVLWLLEGAEYVTGETVMVDSGMHLLGFQP